MSANETGSLPTLASDPILTLENLRARADMLMDSGRNAEALPILDQALRLDPSDADLLCLKATAFGRLGDSDRAMEMAEEAVAADPTFEWAHRVRSIAFMGFLAFRGDRPEHYKSEMIKSAREAVRLAPRGTKAIENLCDVYLAAGHIASARRAALRLMQVAPNWFRPYELMGEVCLESRAWREVEEYAQKALQLNPSSFLAMHEMGVARMETGRTADAVKYLLEAVRLDPTRQMAQENLQRAVKTHLRYRGLDEPSLLCGMMTPPGFFFMLAAYPILILLNWVRIGVRITLLDPALKPYAGWGEVSIVPKMNPLKFGASGTPVTKRKALRELFVFVLKVLSLNGFLCLVAVKLTGSVFMTSDTTALICSAVLSLFGAVIFMEGIRARVTMVRTARRSG